MPPLRRSNRISGKPASSIELDTDPKVKSGPSVNTHFQREDSSEPHNPDPDQEAGEELDNESNSEMDPSDFEDDEYDGFDDYDGYDLEYAFDDNNGYEGYDFDLYDSLPPETLASIRTTVATVKAQTSSSNPPADPSIILQNIERLNNPEPSPLEPSPNDTRTCHCGQPAHKYLCKSGRPENIGKYYFTCENRNSGG